MAQTGRPGPRPAQRTSIGQHWLVLLGLLLCILHSSTQASPEPDVDELRWLQRAALRQAHLDERSLRSLETRLRLSPLLPQLRVNVGRGWQWSSSSGSIVLPAPPDDGHMSYGVAAQWDLGRLLFTHEEMALHRDAQRIAAWRTQLLLRVARLYGMRCRAAEERETAKSPEAAERLAGRLAALDVTLAAVIGDEHVGRKLRRCTQSMSAMQSSELDPGPELLPIASSASSSDGHSDESAER